MNLIAQKKRRLLPLALLLSALGACNNGNAKSSLLEPPSGQTSAFDFQVAKTWFDLIAASIDAEDLAPPEASRVLGYAGVALYEAVVPGMMTHKSLANQLNGLKPLPSLPAGAYHWPAVASSALATISAHLFVQPATLQAIADLEAQLEAGFATTVSASTLDLSLMRGQLVGSKIATWSDGDGFSTWNDCAYTPPVGPGLWQPTPPLLVPDPVEPCWGNLRPFALLFAAECSPLAHPPYSTDPASAFAAEALEVYDTVNAQDPAQMESALFWADDTGTLTTPGHWASIVGQVLEQEDSTLDVAAEAYARLGIAVADASISCREIKYYYDLLRPITYIQDPAGPINDPVWTSLVPTPPDPEFTAEVAAQSGAAAVVLTDLLGVVSFTDHTHDPDGLAPRTFASFDAAAGEASLSGLYGGVQFRSGVERGQEQGACVGTTILQNVGFLKP